MTPHHPVLAILLAGALLAGCQSAKKTRDDALLTTGVATMVAVSPLIPIVEGVRDLTKDHELEARRNAFNARHDARAQARLDQIQRRDPVADAATLCGDGVIAFLRLGGVASGLEAVRRPVDAIAQTADPVSESPLFAELTELFDPAPPELTERFDANTPPRRPSPTLDRAADTYRRAFNREMYRLARNNRPRHPASPPSAAAAHDTPPQ